MVINILDLEEIVDMADRSRIYSGMTSGVQEIYNRSKEIPKLSVKADL
jgi:hypothetical protein